MFKNGSGPFNAHVIMNMRKQDVSTVALLLRCFINEYIGIKHIQKNLGLKPTNSAYHRSKNDTDCLNKKTYIIYLIYTIYNINHT